MKKLVVLSYLILSIAEHAVGQVQRPTRAFLDFKNRYEHVSNVVWSDTTNNQVIVKFIHLDENKIAFFNKDGFWLKTHIEIEPIQLMYCIRDQIQENYTNYETVAAYGESTGKALRYYATLVRPDEPTVKKVVSYSNKCEFLKEE